MAVPKKKTTQSKRNMRRSHHALKQTTIVENATTGELQRPHHISLDGYYNGRQVIVEVEDDASEDETLEETL